jgi:hypothetical protein
LCDRISRMSESSENQPQISQEEEQELFDQLVEWANGSKNVRWQNAAKNPETRVKAVEAIREIASLPQTQIEEGASPSYVFAGRHVFNFRAFVLPTIVLILEKVSVMVVPGLDSALLPVLDLIGYAGEAHKIYRKLTPDETAVFGAICDRYRLAKFGPSVTNPKLHPTAKGAQAWFEENKYQAPDDIEEVLDSLCDKGALLRTKTADGITIYETSFLGKKE